MFYAARRTTLVLQDVSISRSPFSHGYPPSARPVCPASPVSRRSGTTDFESPITGEAGDEPSTDSYKFLASGIVNRHPRHLEAYNITTLQTTVRPTKIEHPHSATFSSRRDFANGSQGISYSLHVKYVLVACCASDDN